MARVSTSVQLSRVNGLTCHASPFRTTLGFLATLGSLVGCDATLTSGSHQGGGVDGGPGPEAHQPAVEPTLPGFSVIRRLSREEYQRTVEDLLGTRLKVTESFPADNLGDEFATVGSALSLSPIYVISYERAAHELTTELFESTEPRRDEILVL